jgi:hypothetical protein
VFTVQQISTLPKAPISYWLRTKFFLLRKCYKTQLGPYNNAGREKELVRSDLARTFSDLEMTWLSYCARITTSERAKLRTAVRDQKPVGTRVQSSAVCISQFSIMYTSRVFTSAVIVLASLFIVSKQAIHRNKAVLL